MGIVDTGDGWWLQSGEHQGYLFVLWGSVTLGFETPGIGGAREIW